MIQLRKERRELKKNYEKETDKNVKPLKLHEYRCKQIEIKQRAEEEEAERVESRFQKMIKLGPNGMWKVIKQMKADRTGEWSVMKNEDGKRCFDPEENKKIAERHYISLYGYRPTPHHDYHDYVRQKIIDLEEETFDDRDIDRVPTKKEVEEAIKNKKNNKSTTDWDNEILKRGGEPMVDFIMPVIRAFWREGVPPRQWNEGLITNIFKGKGDREKMENQRGITVSSSIGSIVEEILTKRLMQKVHFSQAQAGGKKGGRAIDHIFILKSLISMALMKGEPRIITFFDIKKAYDRADMNDMLYIVNDQGFNGKVWKLTKSLNENLTARVKTKAGLTDEIKREKGGKQGGKLMVPLFSKMMDTLPEDMHTDSTLGVSHGNDTIASLAFVDDVASIADGYEQQEKNTGKDK